ncbi:hypothetical protein POM88_011861 [Heracleum sosnowskyi]|uniref:Reverse transcriptase zinc-binding domain-containing protein n=1 Tax=Heracleum sosnowskyi TaxID=360622 RepID=A0AAD8MWV2_9APIA|nr:hypothetical protein POM88_011861 [Heracleum sosnowskyi]
MALKQSANDKSPGPDEINFRCLKFLWPSIKGKVLECFKDFEEKEFLPQGFNSSFLALIPKVLHPKEVQEFRSISLINSTTKFLTKDKDWNKWMRVKYSSKTSEGLEDSILSNKYFELINDLVMLLRSSRLGEHLKIDKFKWRVNDGRSTYFWEDSRYEGEPLKEKFKRLYLLSKLKHVEVGIFFDLWDCYNREGNVFWKRSLRNWEKSLIVQLNEVIQQTPLNNKSDLVIWQGNNNKYTVKEGAELLNASISHDCNFKRIWKQKVPPKVQIFIWKVLNGIIPPKALLISRLGNFPVNSNRNFFKAQMEDLNC